MWVTENIYFPICQKLCNNLAVGDVDDEIGLLIHVKKSQDIVNNT